MAAYMLYGVRDRKSLPQFCSHGSVENRHILVAKMLDYNIVESDFELQPSHYHHLRTKTIGKGMNALRLLALISVVPLLISVVPLLFYVDGLGNHES